MHEKPDMEMIIIKRGHPHEEHPHGGAWKVAFADFMTAMMAFFLVLWIVNSTNKETRSSVARYFNPIRISDTTPARKGLKDPKEADFDAAAADERAKPKSGTLNDINGQSGPAAGNGGRLTTVDAVSPNPVVPSVVVDPVTARDPFIVLDEIAGPVTGASMSEGPAVSAEVDLLADGPLQFRDPFAPPSPVVPPLAKPSVRGAGKPTAPPPSKIDLKTKGRVPSSDATADSMDVATTGGEPTPPSVAQSKSTAGKAAAPRSVTEAPGAVDEPAGMAVQARVLVDGDTPLKSGAGAKQAIADAGALKNRISEALREVGLDQGPHLEVRAVDEGLLISLTDDLNFGMFSVGSAEPQKKVVRAMEKIGHILAAQQGTFIIRGHTDGRPFRSAAYDNWRLSSARAQMAAYMLVRGSLDEKRIERIEGHADRALRVPADANAAENRRIEILLRRPK